MFDRYLSKEWAKAAQGFLKQDPRKYGVSPCDDVYLNFIDGKIGEKFDNYKIDVGKKNFKDPAVQQVIRVILDKAIKAEEYSTSPLRTNLALKVATSLRATLDFKFG